MKHLWTAPRLSIFLSSLALFSFFFISPLLFTPLSYSSPMVFKLFFLVLSHSPSCSVSLSKSCSSLNPQTHNSLNLIFSSYPCFYQLHYPWFNEDVTILTTTARWRRPLPCVSTCNLPGNRPPLQQHAASSFRVWKKKISHEMQVVKAKKKQKKRIVLGLQKGSTPPLNLKLLFASWRQRLRKCFLWIGLIYFVLILSTFRVISLLKKKGGKYDSIQKLKNK